MPNNNMNFGVDLLPTVTSSYSLGTSDKKWLNVYADHIYKNGTELGNYTHPTSAGNKHIPSGGSSGQFLKYGNASGTAAWATLTTSDISDFPSTLTPSSHTHGNIQNGGTLQTSDVTIANGDKLVITDSSDSSKIARASISFDGSTTTQALSKKGTWESFAAATHTHPTSQIIRPEYKTGSTVGEDITLQPLINDTRANHLAFLPADQIIIEKTTDGGTTWIDAGIPDSTKIGLFSETRAAVYLPLVNNQRSLSGGIRITFTAQKYNVPANTPETEKYSYWTQNNYISGERYNTITDFYFWVGSNGDRLNIKVEKATGGNPNTWITCFDNANAKFDGWSGSNYIKVGRIVFGGSKTQTSQHWNLRITIFPSYAQNQTAFTQPASAQSISEIRAYGTCWWIRGNQYASADHLYSWDYQKNVTFPANITATKFIGSLQGNGSLVTDINWNNILYNKPTTLNGYGITDAAASSHTHGNITNDGKMSGSTASGNTTVSHKFLREDGTWSIPSYTTNTNTTYTVATGDGNGQIKITPSSGSAYNVDVKGLGSAAYTSSTDYSYKHLTDYDFTNTQPLSKYVTFDKSKPVGAPKEEWYNGFISSHSNYHASYIINGHTNISEWYVGHNLWHENSTPKATAPTWYLLAHSGNVITGDANGQVKIAGVNVNVKGLGSAAYTSSDTYAAAAHGNHVPTVQTTNNITFLRNDNSWYKLTRADVNTLINLLDTGSSDLSANDYVITQYVGGGTTTTTYHRRPANKVVNASLVKAALGTVSTTAKKFLKDTGSWTQVDWGDLTGKPTSFTPSSHDHDRLSGKGRKTTAAAIAINQTDYDIKAFWNIYDSSSRNNDATNSPSFDATVLNLPWDWGAYNGQIAISSTIGANTRLQIRSATCIDNGENASPRYTPSYGAWREVVTATKATQMGSATQPVYISNTGQVTECTALGASAYHADSYFAAANHGNHVPANDTIDEGKFLKATSSAGVYQWANLPLATSSVAGVISVGTGLTADTDGILSLNCATTSAIGGVSIGTGLSVNGSGMLTLNTATTSALGGIKVGTGLSISSGSISVSYGTTSGTALAGNTIVNKVLQKETSTDNYYPILFSADTTSNTSNVEETVNKSSKFAYNPNDGYVITQSDGNPYVSAKLPGDTGSTLEIRLAIASNHQRHGIWSPGYAPTSSTFTSSNLWLIYRDTSGKVIVNGHATNDLPTAGGNITGSIIGKKSSFYYQHTGINKGTTSTSAYGMSGLIFTDKNGLETTDRIGAVACYVSSSTSTTSGGTVSTRLIAWKFAANDTTTAYFAAAYYTTANLARTYTNCRVYGAVWNDYAEYRKGDTIEGGYCVMETPSGVLTKSTERLQPGCRVTSDTFGFAIGETEEYQTPIAVSGRVLVYPYRDRKEYPLGAALCSAPDGKVDIMTREEIREYPERIIGIVSEIPDYEIWYGGHAGNKEEENDKPTEVPVNGRIWIYVR